MATEMLRHIVRIVYKHVRGRSRALEIPKHGNLIKLILYKTPNQSLKLCFSFTLKFPSERLPNFLLKKKLVLPMISFYCIFMYMVSFTIVKVIRNDM